MRRSQETVRPVSSLLCRVRRHKWEMMKLKQRGQTHPLNRFAKGRTETEGGVKGGRSLTFACFVLYFVGVDKEHRWEGEHQLGEGTQEK